MTLVASRALHNRNLLLLSFSGGPLALMRITHPRLPVGYMHTGRHGRAIALLRALDWSTDGEQCLAALQDVVRCALRGGLRAPAESVVQAALGTYFQNKANANPAAQRFAPSVHDLARKFFHHLLRRGRMDKALSLAVELDACDLFADARWAAARAGLRALADEAHALATAAAIRASPSSVHDSTCTESCSQCSSRSSRSVSDDETSDSNRSEMRRAPPLPRLPPLPSCHTVMPVPIVPHEPISTNSIRPLHQYLDRDLTIWNKEISNDPTKVMSKESTRPINTPGQQKTWLNIDSSFLNYTQNSNQNKHLVVSNHSTRVKVQDNTNINPVSKIYNERLMNFNKAYQIEPRNIASSSTYNTIHRYRDDPTTSYDRKTYNEHSLLNIKPALKYPGEKNKVKFSDTVTIAVVPDNGNLRERSEHPGSLPRVHLANWPSSTASPAAPSGTMLDYVETALMHPIPKKGKHLNPTNYRPIKISFLFSRLMRLTPALGLLKEYHLIVTTTTVLIVVEAVDSKESFCFGRVNTPCPARASLAPAALQFSRACRDLFACYCTRFLWEIESETNKFTEEPVTGIAKLKFNRQATSLIEPMTAGEEELSSGDREPTWNVAAGDDHPSGLATWSGLQATVGYL
ncbi:WD repeat-containing and planar cell polarity effector protein fritz homolog [Eumeta japonica]|uniref:WD repeat-containing and planar cell polarity effector protein fritz homolog n=1 Tax=Eumeta variegata TaxID=151549 RepID=A0A4C1U9M8_EUMVA|nr:WD repeat-containing and planar cell polarity effector protein fritz homolog [Eumeta japonica]